MKVSAVTAPSMLRPAIHPPKAKRMRLDNLIVGRIDAPMSILIYGPEGVGKSTFASGAPAPIWLGADKGTNHLDIKRFREPTCFADLLEAVQELLTVEHDRKTLVLDPLGWIQPLVWAETCRTKGWGDIEEPGYGKGYNAAVDLWRVLLAQLDELQAKKGMNLLFIAHSTKKTEKNPDVEDFERFIVDLNASAAGLFRQRCDYVLFARHKVWTKKGEDKRVRGKSDGASILHTSWTAAYDAKSRPRLPDAIPLSWEAFAQAREARQGAGLGRLEELRADLGELLEQVDEKTATQARGYVAAHPDDAAALEEVINALSAELEKKA